MKLRSVELNRDMSFKGWKNAEGLIIQPSRSPGSKLGYLLTEVTNEGCRDLDAFRRFLNDKNFLQINLAGKETCEESTYALCLNGEEVGVSIENIQFLRKLANFLRRIAERPIEEKSIEDQLERRVFNQNYCSFLPPAEEDKKIFSNKPEALEPDFVQGSATFIADIIEGCLRSFGQRVAGKN